MLRIRELRLENNLTQKELAEKISSTSKNIWAYENQISIPPLDVLIKLADFFNCSIDYLANHYPRFTCNFLISANDIYSQNGSIIFIYMHKTKYFKNKYRILSLGGRFSLLRRCSSS